MQDFKELSRKVTIVSFIPVPVRADFKHHMPAEIVVPASSGRKPVFFSVDEPFWFVNKDQTDMPFRSYVSPPAIAESAVSRWKNAQESLRGEPGLWWVEGVVRKLPKSELEPRFKLHWEWMNHVVQMADQQWENYRKSPLAVSELQKACARALKKRPEPAWMGAGYSAAKMDMSGMLEIDDEEIAEPETVPPGVAVQ